MSQATTSSETFAQINIVQLARPMQRAATRFPDGLCTVTCASCAASHASTDLLFYVKASILFVEVNIQRERMRPNGSEALDVYVPNRGL